MRIYSQSIALFLKRLHIYTREILSNEFHVRVTKGRFHANNNWSYPITLVAIDDKNLLGRFYSDDYSIGINRRLMYSAKTTVIKNILRHELAHLFLHIKYGDDACSFMRPHGIEFKKLCEQYGFGPEVSSPNGDINSENEALSGDLQSEKIVEKVRKLLSLANSDNKNEAELATIKANQLIIQHNLQAIASTQHGGCSEIEYFTKLVLLGKRRTPRMTAISSILKDFFVYPIKVSEGLEITGTLSNIENGEYIAHFLDSELKNIWQQHKQENTRLREKAFMVALSRSYRRKLQLQREEIPTKDRNALISLNKELDWAVDGIYGGLLSTSSSSFQGCHESEKLGKEAGHHLQINRGVSTGGVAPLLN